MGNYDLILLNFANPAMLGDTANSERAILSIEFIDSLINII